MNVSIGIRGAARELQLDIDLTEEELFSRVEAAAKDHGVLTLVDSKGQRALVPAEAIGFVLVAPESPRKVGFALS
ncbi:MAG: DUF3107 domain-containing protein [Propionibacterium sp.]|nr:DUF3107 domain-containing protein [Propionibacterium sp.]MDN6565624.1 DUF3107 domain-containing protein [Actinomyces sp.]MDN6794073.1 DUF3107 domain-containing protein [Propionibacterium sp.]